MQVQGRLAIRCRRQRLRGPVPHNLSQLPAEDFISLRTQVVREWKILRKFASHPNALRALACEEQCDFFRHDLLVNRVPPGARAGLCVCAVEKMRPRKLLARGGSLASVNVIRFNVVTLLTL